MNDNILTRIGDYSFGIYLSHVLFLHPIAKIVKVLRLNYIASIILIFMISSIITIIVNMVYYEMKKRLKYDRNKR